jgi:epoxyqueuosine reductase
MVKKMKRFLLEKNPEAKVYFSVDTGPVLERYWAERAGIGWIGRNGCLIVPDIGSWVFLGVLITDLEMEYDSPAERKCAECGKCMEACPTGAIVEPGLVDARKCISYWTVEHKGEFPDGVKKEFRGRVFGCDICQAACPWNEKVPVSPIGDFAPREGVANPDLEWMANLSKEEYDERFRGSAMRRAGVEGLRRNARGVREGGLV